MRFIVDYIGTEPPNITPLKPGEAIFIARIANMNPGDLDRMTKTFKDLQAALQDGKVSPDEAVRIISDLLNIPSLNVEGMSNLIQMVVMALKDGKISWSEALMIAFAIPSAL